MRDYIPYGPVPSGEDCEQVGRPDYDPVKARAECVRFISQIRKQFGPEPEGARLAVKSFPHDFGSYYEVVCYYDDSIEEAVTYAFNGEESWTTWEDEEESASA